MMPTANIERGLRSSAELLPVAIIVGVAAFLIGLIASQGSVTTALTLSGTVLVLWVVVGTFFTLIQMVEERRAAR